ncbi:DAK2 domain-containing protein, partial [Bacillus velezensis]|uniref:DAK2 domain-containing protein n=1 Tax=Bacillus velezensis TaxID=492670 RepID=UPI00201BDF0E
IVEQEKVTIGSFLDGCSMIIMEHCGGASGPIWGRAFRAASKAVGEKRELPVKEFAKILQAALQGIQCIGERSFGRGSVAGDKTLVDALAPDVDSWLA